MIINNLEKEPYSTQIFVKMIDYHMCPCEILAYDDQIIIYKNLKSLWFIANWSYLHELIEKDRMERMLDSSSFYIDTLLTTIKSELQC